MNVAELIKHLSTLPQDAPVVVSLEDYNPIGGEVEAEDISVIPGIADSPAGLHYGVHTGTPETVEILV